MTIYSVTEKIDTISNQKLIAQRERDRFLKSLKQPVKRILTEYSVVSRMGNQTNVDAQADVLSVFDYFQDIVTIDAGQALYFNELPVPEYSEIRGNWERAAVLEGGVEVAIESFFDMKERCIRDVTYFDAYHNRVKTVWYDFRGFKSSEEIFDHNGHKNLQLFYNAAGQLKMTFSYRTTANNTLILRTIWLHDYHGQEHSFDNIYAFLAFFFEEIGAADPDAIFISDLEPSMNRGLLTAKLAPNQKRYLVADTPRASQLTNIIAQYTDQIAGVLVPKELGTIVEKLAVPSYSVPFDTYGTALPLTDLGKAQAPTDRPNLVYYGTANGDSEQRLGKLLAQLDKPVTVTILGHYTSQIHQIKQQAEQQGHTVRIIGLQFHERLLTFLNQADYLLSLDQTDNYSFTMNEAVRLNTEVITLKPVLVSSLENHPLMKQVTTINEAATIIEASRKCQKTQKVAVQHAKMNDWQFLLKTGRN